jgi:4-amino-4-deoxy-L-arabinose transferase-like glycosyltransferase
MLEILKKIKPISLLLIVVLLTASFLRLYNLPHNMMFLGDQGRDAIIVKDIFTKFDLVFIGPVTSVGNMYLGPLYYYFMVPWLMLSYPSPVGPAYAVAILGIITVFLIYYLGKKMIGERAALIGATLFGLSSTVANNSRFSWNPNPAPFAALLMIFFTYWAWKKSPKYWVLVALFFSVLIQLHYLTLLSAAGAGLIWLVQLNEVRTQAKKLKKFFLFTVLAFFLFLSSLTPLILFDFKHDNLNARAFGSMLTGESNFTQNEKLPLSQKAFTVIKETHGRGMHILFEISVGKHRKTNTLLLLGTLGILSYLIFDHKKNKKKNKYFSGRLVLIIYLGTAIVGTSFYGHSIFDHYISYLFPVTFLILGMVLDFLIKKGWWGKAIGVSFFIYFLIFNYSRYNLKTAGWSVFDVERTASSITNRVKEGDKYNIVLLSGTGDLYGQSYRYFLDITSAPPLTPEHSDQSEFLFIINEDQPGVDVTSLPIHEIIIFPDKNIKEVYNIENGPEITVLQRNAL